MKPPSIRIVHPITILVITVTVFYCVFAVMMGWTAAVDGGDNPLIRSPLTFSVAQAGAVDGLLARTGCGRCAVVESVRKVSAHNAAGFGASAGGLTGSLVGAPATGTYSRDLLTVVGALLGAMVGNRYEQQARTSGVYEIAVRYGDGSSRVLTVLGEPAWKPGDRVRIIGGRIWPDT